MASEAPVQARVSAGPLEARGLTKSFGDFVANDAVAFRVEPGTIHALVGENGAGKSTCVNMLFGMLAPDQGEVLLDGVARRWRSAQDASAAGIGMVHQHFMLAPSLSGLDNVILGAEPVARRFAFGAAPIDRRGALERLTHLAREQGFDLDLRTPAGQLPVGAQQRLEILKLLYRDARILILDEPTAVLTPGEAAELYQALLRLTAQGRSVLLISHKLSDVLQYADHVTVLRRGRVVASQPKAGLTESDLAVMMVGRPLKAVPKATPRTPAVGEAPLLEVKDLTLWRPGQSRRQKPLLANISLTVDAGEIVAIAGVEGNGQSELMALLASPVAAFSGRSGRAEGALTVLGRDGRLLTTAALRNQGVGMVPEDRHRQALCLELDLAQNFLLGQQRRRAFGRFGLLSWSRVRQGWAKAAAALDVRPCAPETRANDLSGGNQQKLVMARELWSQPRLLFCSQPTRGVDIGAMELIHDKLRAARAAGAGVLLVSSDLDEILAIADRILVMSGGAVRLSVDRAAASHELIGRAMGGGGDRG